MYREQELREKIIEAAKEVGLGTALGDECVDAMLFGIMQVEQATNSTIEEDDYLRYMLMFNHGMRFVMFAVKREQERIMKEKEETT